MIDYLNIRESELSYFGIALDNQKEFKLFVKFVLEELEVKIGKRISEGLSEEKLKEFDMITDNTKANEWLVVNRPDFREIVKKTQTEIAWDLLKYRKQFSTAETVPEHKGFQRHIQVLELTPYSYNCLCNAKLFTIRDVIDCNDVNDIAGIDKVHAQEIVEKIVDYLIP